MNKYIVLTKALLKNGNGLLNGDKKKRIKAIAIAVAVILACIPTIVAFIYFIQSAYDLLYKINQQGLIFSVGISFTFIFIFFFAILYSLNVLYFSRDIENLLPLPLKPWQILASKFTITLLYEYLTEAVILLPLFIIYGLKGNMGFVYYAYSVILFLTIPIIPLSMASILNIVIMRFTNMGNHKDFLKIIGGILAMVLAVVFNVKMQNIGTSGVNEKQILSMLNEGNNSLVGISSRVFPGASQAVKAIVFNESFTGLKNIILFLIITLCILLIFLTLGQKLYFKGVIGISEAPSRRRKLNNEDLQKASRKSLPIKSLVIKELKILFRTPVYFMNCIIMNFLWPVFLIIPFLAEPEIFKKFKNLVPLLNDTKWMGFIIVVSLAAGVFITSSNLITSTAVSREGENLFVSKYIAVGYDIQLMAKVLSGVIMGMVGIIALLLMLFFLIELPAFIILIVFVSSLPGILFSAMFGIIIDVSFPKLNWDNEVKAVKQNFNGFIAIMVGIGVSALIVMGIMKFNEDKLLIGMIILLLFLALDYILYKFISAKGSKLFEKIEV
ncbi:transporter [Clostridium sp. P21]|uniref:Transporter n=1 Tax=Clostridium muellerianum TaxID=2716538 RepID=A0A7Y0EKC6_9CLOT|nr:transporter [Clostridium muellerianum]NMM64987.1 transporter [Clostridium muellerianum]